MKDVLGLAAAGWNPAAARATMGAVRALLALVVVGALSGCGGGTAAPPPAGSPPAGPLVRVADFSFTPHALTVPIGTTVTWEFEQPDAPHNVVSTTGPAGFDSGPPQGRGVFRFTFRAAGTYTYLCQVHPNMTGTVVVTP